MKRLLALALLCLGMTAYASPYFRTPFNGGPDVHYTGVFIDPREPGKTTVGTEVALFTHDPKDGCLLPNIICEQWSPVATGLSVTGGKVFWDIGPTVNVFPWMTKALDEVGIPQTFASPDAQVSFAFGPKLGLNPIESGRLQSFNHWDPRLLLMTAAQLRW